MDEVLRFWSRQASDPQAPTITAVHNGLARRLFDGVVRPHLAGARVAGTCIGMPHPSEQRSYEFLCLGAIALRGQLRPSAGDAVRRGPSGGVQTWLPFP